MTGLHRPAGFSPDKQAEKITFAPGPRPESTGPLLSEWLGGLVTPRAGQGFSLQKLSAAENKALEKKLGPQGLLEILALSEESDPEIFYQTWWNFALRQQDAGNLEVAVSVYQRLAQGDSSLRETAQRQWDALAGRGSVGGRLEVLLGQFSEQATDPAMLGGMLVASTVFQGTRLLGLSRLLSAPEAGWLTRGAGARFLASSMGFAAEVPSFLLTSKGLHQAMGKSQDWSSRALLGEGFGLGLNLLFLKSFGALGRRGVETLGTGTLRTAPGLIKRISADLFPQAASFAGIYLGHRAEIALGLRPHLDDATTLTDSLTFLLQFHVGGQLSGALQGPKFARTVREMEILSGTLAPRPRTAGTGGFGSWRFGFEAPNSVASSPNFEFFKEGPSPAPTQLKPAFEPLFMSSFSSGESSAKEFLERRLRMLLMEKLEVGSTAAPELQDKFPSKVAEIAENFAHTPDVDAERYFGLMRDSQLQDIAHEDGRVTTRVEQLSVAAKYFRYVKEMNTFRRAIGSLYDHLVQEAFERVIAEGGIADFDALVRVAGVHRRIEAVEKFLQERQWSARYRFFDKPGLAPATPSSRPSAWLSRARDWFSPFRRVETSQQEPVWLPKLSSLPLSVESRRAIERYLRSFDDGEAAAPFRDKAHNYILWKPKQDGSRREAFTVQVAMEGLSAYMRTWQGHTRFIRVLEDAVVPLLHFDRIFKVLATRDLPHKIAEVASSEEFHWGQLEGFLELSQEEEGYDSTVAKINGTVYTGYLYDRVLAEKFARFYQNAGIYMHDVEMKIRLGRFHHRAQELLESKVTQKIKAWVDEKAKVGFAAPAMQEIQAKRHFFQGQVNYDKPEILSMLRLNPTPVAKRAIEAIEGGEVDLRVFSKDQLRNLWRGLPHGERDKEPPQAIFVPAHKNPGRRPLIAVTELDPNLTFDQKILRAISLAAITVHEFEHYLHADLDNVMISEMRSWLEETYFLMHHGELGPWYEMQETAPYGFGIYLRNLVDKDYLEGPRDVVFQP
ncbi:MAG: hypothetical protein K8R69_10340 [Deltaproteobacteria bacterium]|nr:hypothetical protein [Deltaproteobacteria bacterium]